MRNLMRAVIAIAVPGVVFAPLISEVDALQFCRTWSDHGLLLLLNELPPCPTLPSAALAVPLVIAAGALTVASALLPAMRERNSATGAASE